MMVSEKPTIKLLFTGLQVFFFEKGGTSCRVGIHNQAPNHQLCVEVREFYNDVETRLTNLTEDAKGHDIRLNVINPMTGVEVYRHGDFKRESSCNDEKDFRWIIGIRSPEFHGAVQINDDVIQPSFYTNCGLFHTHSRVRARLIGGKDRIDQELEIADYIGADINLHKGCNEAVLTYGINGKHSLHLKNKPNTRYEIVISNDCPKDVVTESVESEFRLYYKVFDVKEDEQFDLVGVGTGEDEGRLSSPQRPCAPVCGQGDFC